MEFKWTFLNLSCHLSINQKLSSEVCILVHYIEFGIITAQRRDFLKQCCIPLILTDHMIGSLWLYDYMGFAMFGQLGTTNSRKLLPIKPLPCCAYWIWRYYPVRFTGIGSLNATNILPYYTELLIFNFSFLFLLTNVVCM